MQRFARLRVRKTAAMTAAQMHTAAHLQADGEENRHLREREVDRKFPAAPKCNAIHGCPSSQSPCPLPARLHACVPLQACVPLPPWPNIPSCPSLPERFHAYMRACLRARLPRPSLPPLLAVTVLATLLDAYEPTIPT